MTDLAKLSKDYQGKKIVAASGVFDLLHVGHVQYLQSLQNYGDVSVVLVKPDARIARHKHANRPIIPEADRAQMVDAIKGVDYVVIGSYQETTDESAKVDAMYEAFFDALKPDIYVSTNEEWSKLEEITKAKIKILPRIPAGHFESTTAILKYVRNLDSF